MKCLVFDKIRRVGPEMDYGVITSGFKMKEWFQMALLDEGSEFMTWKEMQDLETETEQDAHLRDGHHSRDTRNDEAITRAQMIEAIPRVSGDMDPRKRTLRSKGSNIRQAALQV